MPQEFCPNPFFYYRGVPFSGGFRYPHPNCVDADPPVPAGTLVPSLLDKSITQVGCGSFFVVALSAAVEGGPGVSLTASGHRGTAILPPPTAIAQGGWGRPSRLDVAPRGCGSAEDTG